MKGHNLAAKRMGTRHSGWMKWEKDFLNDRAGFLEAAAIVRAINKRRDKEGLPPRTKSAIYSRASIMGLSLKMLGSHRQTISGWATSLAYFTASGLYDAYDRYAEAHPGTRRRPGNGKEMVISLEVIDKVLAFRVSLARRMGTGLLRAHGLRRAAIAVENWKPDTVRTGKHPSRKVQNITTGQIFPSLAEAARSVGRSPSALTYAINRKTQCSKFLWEYASPPIQYKRKKPTVLVSLNDGRVWCDERQAAAELGISPVYIKRAAMQGYEIKGLRIAYKERAGAR